MVKMKFEAMMPKYVRLAEKIQQQIKDGTYTPGELLPSETRLVKESGLSRPTVVRALEILKRDGWIESRQGYGTVVRARRESIASRQPRGQIALERIESQTLGFVVNVGFVKAPLRIANLLDIKEGTAILLRRFLVKDGDAPCEISCSYFCRDMIDGTELASPDPLVESTRSHMEARAKVHYDTLTERILTRKASDEEGELLNLDSHERPLCVLAAAHDTTGRALQAIEVLLPPDGSALQEVYRLQ